MDNIAALLVAFSSILLMALYNRDNPASFCSLEACIRDCNPFQSDQINSRVRPQSRPNPFEDFRALDWNASQARL